MKLLNAWTQELDNPEIAVSEILDQLDFEKNAQTNSAGFITCSYDFVESGIVKAIYEALPFDVVGCTTLTNANNAEAGTMLLCLTVLTADDCRFATALTDPIKDIFDKAVSTATQAAESDLGQPVKLALAFLPMIYGVGGEIMLSSLDKALRGAPIFGTIACDYDTAAYSNSYTIYNGECYRERISIMLVSGNIAPRFVVTSTSEQNLRKQQAVITSSEGSLLKEVNNMRAKEYFSSIGLVTDASLEGMSSVPFVVDYNDGTQPVARAIYGLNEDGSAVCGGVMPEGSTLSIGQMDVDDIILTAQNSSKTLIETENVSGIILFPCLGRNMVLAVDPFAEIEAVRSIFGDAVPWHLAYSGGECCPVYTSEGKPVSRFHNFTFIGCAI